MAHRAINASPPMTPPAIAPTGVELLGDEDAAALADAEDEDADDADEDDDAEDEESEESTCTCISNRSTVI